MKKYCSMAAMAVCVMIMTIILGACSESRAEYELQVTGIAETTGVIEFLDYSINVYADQASNPCGDCADQPVHLFVNDDAAAIAEAIKDVILRADDLWEVSSVTDSTIVLRLKKGETSEGIGSLSAPSGVSITGTFTENGKKETVLSKTSDTSIVYKPLADKQPQRIAAVYGPSYEMLAVLGAEDKIVVRADVQTDSFPWAEEIFARITEVPKLYNVHTSVNFEQLMNYSPDIVFTFPRQNELKQLADANVYAVEGKTYDNLEDACELLKAYAAALGGDAQEKCEQYCSYFTQKLNQIEEITQTIPKDQRKSVYYAGTDALTTYGRQSDVVDIIEAAGAIAVSESLPGGNRVQINYEKLIEWNPDYIFLDHGGMNNGKTVEEIKNELMTEKQYAPITAVLENNVFMVPSGTFYWDMGLQKILLVEYMAKMIYPDYFQELDMSEELIEFYHLFYGYDLTQEQAKKILERQAP